MKIHQVNDSAEKIFDVDVHYQRFNQKYNMIIQSSWNPEIRKIEEKRRENLDNYTKKNKPGYSSLDYAYLAGSVNYFNVVGHHINLCDQGFNSWNFNMEPIFTHEKENLTDFQLTKAVKKAAKMYGASAIGIAPLERKWVYSHWYDERNKNSFPIIFTDEYEEYNSITKPTVLSDNIRVIPYEMNKVIVLLFEMNYECLRYAPTTLAFASSYHTYAKMSLVTMSLAGMIKSLGYEAIPSANCTGLNIPMAVDAGLGQVGRNGKLINPQFGSLTRIAKILTNMPLIPDYPIDFGVSEFCNACRKCARECPTGAVSIGPRVKEGFDETSINGYLRWAVDHKKCYTYWCESGTNCNICISTCSYNRGYKWTENILNSFSKEHTLVDTLLDALEDEDFGTKIINQNYSFWSID